MKKGIRIYNLYPKLVGSMEKWIEHFDIIKSMNFDWIYVNPINLSGFSGSDYAIKDYYLYHPLFITGEMDFSDLEAQKPKGDKLLKKVCKEAQKRQMMMMMDLVINHTAIDSPLTKEHPNWYMKKEDGSIKNPRAKDGEEWIEWGDLAQINNLNSSDRENLWKYWLDMVLYYADLGMRGFRCDAAYHVPRELWEYLIKNVKEKYPDSIFIGETLGCEVDELVEVAEGGFDYVMNSFKWWNLKENWFMKEFKEWGGKYPSITFPENHDTTRYAAEVNGNKNLAIMRYALSAYFCTGVAITIGFEYGFQRKIDVVKTNPSWWEGHHFDICNEISKINEIKSEYKVLQEDDIIKLIEFEDEHIFGFVKTSQNGKEKVLIVANTDGHHKHPIVLDNISDLLESKEIKDISHGYRMYSVPENLDYEMEPGETKVFYVHV